MIQLRPTLTRTPLSSLRRSRPSCPAVFADWGAIVLTGLATYSRDCQPAIAPPTCLLDYSLEPYFHRFLVPWLCFQSNMTWLRESLAKNTNLDDLIACHIIRAFCDETVAAFISVHRELASDN